MTVTYDQETCTRNLCKSSCTESMSIWYKLILVKVFCMQSSTADFQDRNCPARDTNRATWLAGQLFCTRNCDELGSNQIFHFSFLCKFLTQVSGTSFV